MSKKQQESKNHPVVLFDGYCHLCDGTVSNLLKLDREKILQFAPLQGNFAKDILEKHPEYRETDSILLVEGDQISEKSEAVFKIIGYLPPYLSWFRIMRIIPLPIRDVVYDWIAKNRIRFMGKRETCRMPTPEERAQFKT